MTQTIDRNGAVDTPCGGLRGAPSCLHRRRSARSEPRRRRRERRPVRRAEGAAAAQGPLLPRPGHHPRRACRARRAVRPAGGPPGRRQRPEHPGLVRIYKDLDSPAEQYENAFHCDATWREAPPMGSVLRCVEGPAVGGDTIWVDMVEAYKRLPEHIKTQIADLRARHSIESTFGAKLPIEQRLALKGASRTPSTRWCATHPETGEKVLFVNAFTTASPTSTPRAGPLRLRLQPRRQRAAQLPDPPGVHPGVPGALALDEEQLRHLGQPLHPALRRPGLLPRRPQDGARRIIGEPTF